MVKIAIDQKRQGESATEKSDAENDTFFPQAHTENNSSTSQDLKHFKRF